MGQGHLLPPRSHSRTSEKRRVLPADVVIIEGILVGGPACGRPLS